jgi:hypothetical protein
MEVEAEAEHELRCTGLFSGVGLPLFQVDLAFDHLELLDLATMNGGDVLENGDPSLVRIERIGEEQFRPWNLYP